MGRWLSAGYKFTAIAKVMKTWTGAVIVERKWRHARDWRHSLLIFLIVLLLCVDFRGCLLFIALSSSSSCARFFYLIPFCLAGLISQVIVNPLEAGTTLYISVYLQGLPQQKWIVNTCWLIEPESKSPLPFTQAPQSFFLYDLFPAFLDLLRGISALS